MQRVGVDEQNPNLMVLAEFQDARHRRWHVSAITLFIMAFVAGFSWVYVNESSFSQTTRQDAKAMMTLALGYLAGQRKMTSAAT